MAHRALHRSKVPRIRYIPEEGRKVLPGSILFVVKAVYFCRSRESKDKVKQKDVDESQKFRITTEK